LVAASRRDPQAIAEFAREFGAKPYTEYAQLLGDPGVDIVVIALPHHLHTEAVRQAAAAGKHILLEKPLAPTIGECDSIIAAAEASGVQMMVGLVNRFAREYRLGKQILDSGELGEIVHGIGVSRKGWMEPNRRDWHMDRATGGGMTLTVGIHTLDRLTWLMDSEIERVSAGFATRFYDQKADDTSTLFLRYRNGAWGTVTSTGYQTGVRSNYTEITCTKGILRMDNLTGVSIGRGEKWEPVPDSMSPDWMQEALCYEWKAFLEAIETGSASPVSGRYARHIMVAIFAAEESSRVQQEVEVPRI
jgi:predicted dehydrogenase